MNIIQKTYNRKTLDKNCLYVFTDNLNRSSGNNLIDINSEYYKKYGLNNNLFYPNSTTAQIRGCDNAYPISTMRNQFKTQLSDSEFKKVSEIIKDEIETILKNSINYDLVAFPYGQIGIGKYSNMKLHCPVTFEFLQKELKQLIISIKKI